MASPSSHSRNDEGHGLVDHLPNTHSDESPCPLPLSHTSPLRHKLVRHEDITAEENRFGQGGFCFVHRDTYKGLAVVCKYFHSRFHDGTVGETHNRELKALELDHEHENIVVLLRAACILG